jgi:hypothetical protein
LYYFKSILNAIKNGNNCYRMLGTIAKTVDRTECCYSIFPFEFAYGTVSQLLRTLPCAVENTI